MRLEKIVLSTVAVLFGLLVAGVAFYLYQSTKVIPTEKSKTITLATPTPTTTISTFLSVDLPKDEEVVENKIVTVSGKTAPDATVVVITDTSEQVVTPASNGNFSTTVTIGNGQNQIEIRSIAKDGQESKTIRTVTYSTENF